MFNPRSDLERRQLECRRLRMMQYALDDDRERREAERRVRSRRICDNASVCAWIARFDAARLAA